jgi:hypothetical protein
MYAYYVSQQDPNPLDTSVITPAVVLGSAIPPLTVLEQHTTLKRLKTHHQDNKGVITLKSLNNHTVSLVQVPTARVGSANASIRTLQHRSHILNQVNNISSAPSNASPSEQQQHTSAQLKAVCKQSHVTIIQKLTIHDMLHFDQITHLPYNLVRTIRSFFQHHNLNILPSEHIVRQHTKHLQYQYEIGTYHKDDAVVPFCRISDLAFLLNTTITSLYNEKQLMQYPNMPHRQVQILTQTDKGGESTKLSIQIVNQLNINSVKHVLPVACYEGKYSVPYGHCAVA